MRKTPSLLAPALTALLAGCGAADPPQQETPDPPALQADAPEVDDRGEALWQETESQATAGQISIDPAPLYVGERCTGEVVQASANLRNRGTEPLRVSAISLQRGGFAKVQLLGGPTLPLTLQPGQRVQLKLQLTLPNNVPSGGALEGRLQVSSNDPQKPQARVALSALILPPSLGLSVRQVNYGEAFEGRPETQRLQVRNYGHCPVKLSAVSLVGSLSSWLAVDGLSASDTLASGRSRSFRLTLACRGSGDVRSELRLHSGADRLATAEIIGYCNGD